MSLRPLAEDLRLAREQGENAIPPRDLEQRLADWLRAHGLNPIADAVPGIDIDRQPVANGHGLAQEGRQLVAEAFTAIRVEPTSWLWDRRIPLGTATLLVGREKLGKSMLTAELAARLSRGELAGDLAGASAATLLVSYEDSAAQTIRPRLLAAGADLEHVHRVVATRDGARDLVSLPSDVERIGELALEYGARFVVVDPLSASLAGSVDAHRDQDIRRALAPLVALAEEADLALLATAHWNKAPGGDSLSRVLGSRGLTAAVRSVLAFGRAPDAEEGSPERVLAHPASNLAPEAPSLACRIEGREVPSGDGEVIPTSRLVIGEEIEATADDLLATRSDDERSDREVAAEWLADELADGGWHESREVKARAKAEGISERTLKRAKQWLGIEDRREGYPAVSEWRLPVGPTPSGRAGPTEAGPTGEPRSDSGIAPDREAQSGQDSETGPTEADAAPDDGHSAHCECATPARSPRPFGTVCMQCGRPVREGGGS